MIVEGKKETSSIPPDAVMTALDRILQSPYFAKAPKKSTLLRHTVTRAMDGDQASLNGLAISAEAFGRDIDGPDDPYVRNLAREVRRSLDDYYQHEGQEDSVLIELPVGSYIPRFSHRQQGAVAPAGRPGTRVVIDDAESILPTISVIPFSYFGQDFLHSVIGDILAGSLIRSFSHNHYFNVTAQLSSSQLRDQPLDSVQIAERLHSDYMIGGYYMVNQDRVIANIELVQAEGHHVLWAEQVIFTVGDCMSPKFSAVDEIVNAITRLIFRRDCTLCLQNALHDLKSYALLFGGTQLMHSADAKRFDRAHRCFDLLAERNPLSSLPQALLAYWYFLRINRSGGYSGDVDKELQRIEKSVGRALDLDSYNSLALTSAGAVEAYYKQDLDRAFDFYDQALDANPSDVLATCHKAALLAFTEQGAAAVELANRALNLSPLDPFLYLFKTIAATAYETVGDFEQAEQSAQEAFMLNRNHTSTVRELISIKVELGKLDEARRYARFLRELDPDFSTAEYSRRHPTVRYPSGQRFVENLRKVGL